MIWFITAFGEVDWIESPSDEERIALQRAGNYFTSKAEAVRVLQSIRKVVKDESEK